MALRMQSGGNIAPDDDLMDSYQVELNRSSLRSVRILSIAAGLVYLVLSYFDNFIAPEHLTYSLTIRAGILLYCVLIFYATFFQKPGRHADLLGLSMILILGFGVNLSIWKLGYASGYDAGLFFVYLATAAVPCRMSLSIGTGLIVYALYAIPVLLSDFHAVASKSFVIRNIFHLSMLAAAGGLTYFLTRLRRQRIIDRLTIQKLSLQIPRSKEAKHRSTDATSRDVKFPLTSGGRLAEAISPALAAEDARPSESDGDLVHPSLGPEDSPAGNTERLATHTAEAAEGAELDNPAEFENMAPHLPTILVAEDTPGQLILTVERLRQDYNLLLANNGREALDRLERYGEKVSLILSDVKMPEMDGFEFCQEVLRQEKYRHIPFIFLTAFYHEEEQLRGLRFGATDYLQKPFSEVILREKIDHWITVREHERMLDSTIDSLQSRNQQMGKLAEIIEHEIKNPLQTLNFIHQAITQLRREHYAAADKDAKEMWDYIAQVENVVESIVSVISSSKQLQSEMVSAAVAPQLVTTLLDESLAQTRLLTQGIRIEVNHAIAPETIVKCDRKMLTQVFINLIRNATEAIRDKPDPTDGRITLRTSITAEQKLQIDLSDNGVGISREALGNLFRYRHSTKKDGTGIGLYLSRKILRLHGGEIVAKPAAGCGTTFTITLPM